jgi:hypothetical protein
MHTYYYESILRARRVVYYELVEYTYTFVHELVLASMHTRQSAT